MLTAMHITGRCDVQGSTGEVFRLVGAGQVRSLELEDDGVRSPLDVAFASVVTLTSTTTYQEIGEMWLAGASARLSFVTIGSGYLIHGHADRQRTAVSLSRSTPAGGGKEFTVISSCLVFDPLDHTCEVTAIVFGAFPEA